MNIGEKLKLRRIKAGFTQEQIAAKMNITRQTLSNWEVGKNTPDINSIIELAQIYSLSLDELLLGKIFFKGVLGMYPKLTKDEIKITIKNHFPEATNVSELTGGLASQNFTFEVNGQCYVFKTGTRMEVYEKENLIYNNYKGVLPLRSAIQINESEQHQPYAIYHFIEGVKVFDLNSEEIFDIVPSVLQILSDLKSINVSDSEGYGHFDGKGKAPYRTWIDFIEAIYNEDLYNWHQIKNKSIDTEMINEAIRKLITVIPSINLRKKQLIHGDLGSFNLIAHRGRISGIIDWSLSMYGDHLYDVANFLFWNEEKLQPLIAHLKVRYMSTLEERTTLACYMLRIGLEELYNTVILNQPGYDVEWVANRLRTITKAME
ncbi:phosphotransferase [Paenibacillus eucommiae]|uniref:Transcriptional regulator with XRE-family HTH domain n=1 Tax=Paenibacillus eucommiae TaxID=1355755 RepID=A0ABS4JE02_9BACL|nr:phosphotransferase [Paenibacillus eucommiae]MBP1996944.1 transcriptional regulator with XRE-family HTH domain [Paenibacillus eucommiae]